VAQVAFGKLMAGDHVGAIAAGRETIREFYAMGYVGRIPSALKAQASHQLTLGHPERAVRLAAAAARLTDEVGGDVPEALIFGPDAIDRSRSLLSQDEYARGVEEGHAMSLEQAIAYALEDAPAG
jgi:hypothetical protein